MYRKYHTKGVIISSKIEGVNNRRVNLFTEDLGLVNARIQGVRLLRNKLRNGAQDFSLGEFSLVHGKAGWRVVSTRAEKNLFEIFRNQTNRLKIVKNVLGLIRKLVDEEETHGSLFGIIINFFGFLEKAKKDEIALAECLTLMRILNILGYMRHDPELSIPLSSSEIEIKDLETIAPCRAKMVHLINESLKAT